MDPSKSEAVRNWMIILSIVRSLVLWAETGGSSLIGPELVQEMTNKKGKLAQRYVGPFEILERIDLVAYRLRLPEELNSEDQMRSNQDKYVADILKKFDFVTVKTASTPIETNKALHKDEEAKDVDILEKSTKIKGLWYPIDSPFDLEAFSDRIIPGASLTMNPQQEDWSNFFLWQPGLNDGMVMKFGVKTGSSKVNACYILIFQSLNSLGLSTGSFTTVTIVKDPASMLSQTNSSDKCRLFLLIQSFSTSSDTTC
ncbi:hypothetical protein Tco_1032897 [Tanacetum coccineum]|uniref:Tf2-1-like SH3-like domain-containing protein n=1 Tax=Tanacetum coccineum TaxID=301880 RepID=A0ABQ5GDL4_9ASTR